MGDGRGEPGQPGKDAEGTTGGEGGAGGAGGAGDETGGTGGEGGTGGAASGQPQPVELVDIRDPKVSMAGKILLFLLAYGLLLATVVVIVTAIQPGPPF